MNMEAAVTAARRRLRRMRHAALCVIVAGLGLAVGVPPVGAQDPAALNQRVSALLDAGKYADALPLAHQAVELSEQAHGATHPAIVPSLNNLALAYEATGAYAKAEPVFLRALAIYRGSSGPNDPAVATTLNNLGSLYRTMGAYAKAEPFFRQALAIKEKSLGPDHPDVATSLNNLAEMYRTVGQYGKAEPLYRRTLALYEAALGPSHLAAGVARNNLALLYDETGDYAKAEPLYREALAIYEQALGPTHPDVANTLNNLAGLYQATGLYEKAAPLYERALAVRQKVLGGDHADVATSLNNLGDLYRVLGAYAKAEPLYRRAYTINVKALGPEHRAVAATVNNLAMMYEAVGNYAEAERVYRGAVALYEKALGPTHADYATAVNNLAVLYHGTGAYHKAEPLFRHVLTLRQNALGPEHPDVAGSLLNLASVAAAQGNYAGAVRYVQTASSLEDRLIPNVFAFTTEKQKLQFIQTLSGSYYGFLSLVQQHLAQDPAVVREALQLVWRRKGIVFDAESRARETLRARLPDAARKVADEVFALREKLAGFLLHRPVGVTAAQHHTAIETLLAQIEERERRLASESAAFAREYEQKTADIAAVARRLPKRAALLEFVKFREYDFRKGAWGASWRYLAFALTADGTVTLVDLGEADPLDTAARRAVESIHVAMSSRGVQILPGAPKTVRPAGKSDPSLAPLAELYRKLWAPLEPALGGADRVLLGTDGLLNLVPFAALRDQAGRSLVERYQLAYITTGRELAGAEHIVASPQSALLLVANPTFDLKSGAAVKGGIALRYGALRSGFEPLPGTEQEAKDIPSLVPDGAGAKTVFVETHATERAVKNAQSPRILHLATHGFFLQDEAAPASKNVRGLTLSKPKTAGKAESQPAGQDELQTARAASQPSSGQKYENPLVRSGLAFAGANYALEAAGGDDGLLTALEITGMDLAGTELVVLSACETAVGEVHAGEGVFGLRRAFAIAGAKNLMMSLWPVSDEVTANQMKSFYGKLQKLPPAEALRQAQVETIRALQAKDGTASPGLWAPFILQGAQALGP
jgi:CHAT domain-containing protein/Tfp pilus assembly protein PilF